MKTDEGETRAQQLFQKILKFYSDEKLLDGEASTQSDIGDLYKRQRDKLRALERYDRARLIYLSAKNIHGLGGLLRKIGDLKAEGHPEISALGYFLLEEANSASRASRICFCYS